ncbi:DUF2281 domain-containing protein [Iningainema tapete]|uniref:DUF2281 domain-containing protein n=1 Tax=Iningainema tapete BLCC-T55 TaxID=2748662 RepID=A0A8J6XGG2_9CYAN|nr:DUF2281 domain-containing protein [Iningainema tapete]MBD2771521.1 DUF2281 domain-containing protein [Iningainema tapete BLCC-T55]
MTFQTQDLSKAFITKLQALPPEQQQQVLDFVDFLTQKYSYSHATQAQKRILGLNRGDIWISDDFNDPLPDEFWTGEQ